MTTFMKLEVILYFILKVFGYFCGFAGTIGFFGLAGPGENTAALTTGQFFLYEFFAICLIALSFAAFFTRELIRDDVKRRHHLRARRVH